MSFTFTAAPKDPQASLRHSIDWSPWLESGETITAQTVTAPDGITTDQVTQADGVVSYRISGGTAGGDYKITCQITTSTGRVDQRSVLYRVRER